MKKLKSKMPFQLKLVAEFSGKLFYKRFGEKNSVERPYHFLGYTTPEISLDMHNLVPVRFTGQKLEIVDSNEIESHRVPDIIINPEEKEFKVEFGTPDKLVFLQDCPEAFRGKTMDIPRALEPSVFVDDGYLLLQGRRSICIADCTPKLIAKLPIKGELADVAGNYLLTVSGRNCWIYAYDPKSKIRIYELLRNEE